MGLSQYLSYVPIDCPRMARLEELTELDVWEKEFPFTPTSP